MFDAIPAANNRQMAALLFNIATLLQDRQDNPYRIRAYRNSAHALMRRTSGDITAPLRHTDKTLPHPKGVLGDRMQKRMREAVQTGSSSLLEELCEGLPPAVASLLHVPGIGPRTATALVRAGIENLEQMLAAARDGRLANIYGFGPKRIAQAAQLSLFEDEGRAA